MATQDVPRQGEDSHHICKGANCASLSKGSGFSPFLEGHFGMIIGGVILIALVLVIWFVPRIWRRIKDYRQEFRPFTLKELIHATDNFSRLIGKGGQGSVYEGHLSRNRKIAVKKPSMMDDFALKQFRVEVNNLSKIRHDHLVKLLGFCNDSGSPFLVYEYISNGDLHSLLFNEEKSKVTPWNVRHRIAVKVAEGLKYLHSSNVLHRDIKAENVLLTDQLEPKIADFGLAKVFIPDEKELWKASVAKGTFGYMCPSYCRDGTFEPCCDVFSYGVLLVQLLTGLPAIVQSETTLSLAVHFREELKKDGLEGMLAPSVAASDLTTKTILRKVATLAEKCVRLERESRPSLDYILKELKSLEAHLPENKGNSLVRVAILTA